MKRWMTIIILSTGLIAGPVLADYSGSSRRDTGGAIGAVVGALVGANIGHGKGRVVGAAAGAVGGYFIGREIAHNGYENGYGAPAGPRRYHDGGGYRHGYGPPPIVPMNERFIAKTTGNVRAGPGTRYAVTDTVYRHQTVRVVGKVEGRAWYLVNTRHGQGFVYAPLLRPLHREYDELPWQGGAPRYHDYPRGYRDDPRGGARQGW